MPALNEPEEERSIRRNEGDPKDHPEYLITVGPDGSDISHLENFGTKAAKLALSHDVKMQTQSSNSAHNGAEGSKLCTSSCPGDG